MKRRDFISKASLSTFIVVNLPLSGLLASGKAIGATLELGEDLQSGFNDLVKWMKDQGWLQFLSDKMHICVDPAGGMAQYQSQLTFPLSYGFDDFAGKQLLTPGYPAASLLYHMLASPNVQPPGFQASQYPSTEQIDTLENVIYGLKDYSAEHLDQMVLAVFSYEYRPAFKTPHHQHADLVYSRTGIARIGECPWHYDAKNRCYTNKPEAGADSKKAAVTPARYGVFLARIVDQTKLSQVSKAKSGDNGRTFLLPVRKLFNGDPYIGGHDIVLKEEHVGEKLASLVDFAQTNFGNQPAANSQLYDLNRHPFRIASGTADALVSLERKGSSALVVPKPTKLVQYASQDQKIVCLRVDPKIHTYFSAMETNPVTEVIELIDDVSVNGMSRSPNPLDHPRLAPLFVNIKFKFDAGPPGSPPDFTFDANKISHVSGSDADDDEFVKGTYFAVLFVDGICDGCVTADTAGWASDKLSPGQLQSALPAFSIVTAPDFFPLADPVDLAGFDRDGSDLGTNFFEGGLYSLGAERLPADQHTVNPVTNKPAFGDKSDTLFAVLSGLPATGRPPTDAYQVPSARQYHGSSYLPDVCSGVFAPGWDITYSNDPGHPHSDNYLSTRGLGSPFPEDMKLCAAMNGMWPVASPDASRTYQGHLLFGYENPTAIPLMDFEIGQHPLSAACTDHHVPASTGWDGEQGPFLQAAGDSFVVNFADLARTDTVKQAFDSNLDLSVLRDLTSAELRRRMSCLKLSILNLPDFPFKKRIIRHNAPLNLKKSPSMTALWLVGAEPVNWGGPATGQVIPLSFAGTHFTELVTAQNNKINGQGYLFVFVLATDDSKLPDDTNRRTKACKSVFICQVTESAIAWLEAPAEGLAGAAQLNWNP